MPIVADFTLPASAQGLPIPKDSSEPFYVTIISSTPPETGESWCPDVRRALPLLDRTFSPVDAPRMAYVPVDRPLWKDPSNIYRTKWDLHYVPTVVRYERVDGEIKETGRVVEGEVIVDGKLQALVQ
ncbi:hypothetical protein Micbo1qcDRAFT_200428 [Microdochium bolleyi]|uniref:Thioredoxin domain-containing protein n=1 Tax=Microdochium bolleyi TaxID=196109 RepID=A0A136JCT6_9PEZI|nr:hypothetical protein Micbo1qcDRAFT_200428 [Microdochium bolleyi]